MRLKKEKVEQINRQLKAIGSGITLTDGINGKTKLLASGMGFANLEEINGIILDLQRIKNAVEDEIGVIL